MGALRWVITVVVVAAVLFAAYSLPPLRLKGRPFLDGLSNVAYALPPVTRDPRAERTA